MAASRRRPTTSRLGNAAFHGGGPRYLVCPLATLRAQLDRLVLVETVSAELSLRDPEDIALCARLFELFWEVSRRGDDAIALITELVQQLRSVEDNHGRMSS